jgi:hypothetical protein
MGYAHVTGESGTEGSPMLTGGSALTRRGAIPAPLANRPQIHKSPLHFPPVYSSFICQPMVDVLKEYEITHCYYGHIHGVYNIPKTNNYQGINFTLVSADYLNFIPMILMPYNY